MAVLYTTVGSGQGVSGVFTVDGDSPLTILVPSLSPACAVQVQFATSSGQIGYGEGGYGLAGYGGDFLTPARANDGGAPYTVHSGPGPAWAVLEMPLTQWLRISCVSSQSDTRTFSVLRMAVWTDEG